MTRFSTIAKYKSIYQLKTQQSQKVKNRNGFFGFVNISELENQLKKRIEEIDKQIADLTK